MASTWKRLTHRLAGKTEPEPLWTDDLPNHLDVPVRDWLHEVIGHFGLAKPVAIRLRMPSTILDAEDPAWALATCKDRTNPMLRLEIVDATLGCMVQALEHLPPYNPHRQTAVEYALTVEGILREGGSAYAVAWGATGLEHRADPAVSATIDQALTSADQPGRGSASKHLRTALDAAYALKPDPVRAYSEAIKAAEAAAHATLQPKHATATLGTMLGELRQVRAKISVSITGKNGTEGVDSVEQLMNLLWTGQTSRHGNLQATREETVEEAVMAAHLAALLVQLFTSGGVRRS